MQTLLTSAPLNVLVLCEYSGAVRDAFAARGHHAVSCDLLPSDTKHGHHFQGNGLLLLYPELGRYAADLRHRISTYGDTKHLLAERYPDVLPTLLEAMNDIALKRPTFTDAQLTILLTKWDLVIAHPPCTYLCSSGLHWNLRTPGRAEKTEAALAFARAIWAAPVPRLAMENPTGRIGTAIAKASQYIQPYQFGHDASKKTGLWLRGLANLTPTEYIAPRITADGKQRWANQTDSGQNRLGPSPERWKIRSETYCGVASAMATQWG